MYEDLFINLGRYWQSTLAEATGSPVAGQAAWAIWVTIGILVFIGIGVAFLIYAERRVCGFMQARLGPNMVGPQGILQSVADAVKLMGKEVIVPRDADRCLFMTVPIATAVVALGAFAVIPLGCGMVLADLDASLLFLLAISAFGPLLLWLAGWASANKYAVLGSARAVAQMISYEVPLVLSLVGVIIIAGSLNLSKIVAAQEGAWFIFTQPVACLIFIIAATAECKRAPFDLVEAESEIVAGPFTEYSGMAYGLFMLAEYIDVVAVSALITVCFLGGWLAPFGWDWLPSWFWLFLKLNLVILFIFWIRWTYPRLRVDQLMGLCWKALVPLTLINIAVTGAVVCFAC